MQKLAVIISNSVTEGTSGKTGKPYRINELHVKWNEQPAGAQPYEQEMVVSVMGYINEQWLNNMIATKQLVAITFYVGVREWKDRKFTDIRCYLPKDVVSDSPQTAPSAAPSTTEQPQGEAQPF